MHLISSKIADMQMFGYYPSNSQRKLVRDQMKSRDMMIEITVSQNGQMHYISGPDFREWMEDSRATVADKIQLAKSQDRVLLSLVSSRDQENITMDGNSNKDILNFQNYPNKNDESRNAEKEEETHVPLNILAAAATFAEVYGTPGIDAVLAPNNRPTIDHRSIVNTLKNAIESGNRKYYSERDCEFLMNVSKRRRTEKPHVQLPQANGDNYRVIHTTTSAALPSAFQNMIKIQDENVSHKNIKRDNERIMRYLALSTVQGSSINKTEALPLAIISEDIIRALDVHTWAASELDLLINFRNAFGESDNKTWKLLIQCIYCH